LEKKQKTKTAYKTMGPYAKAGSGKPTRVRKKGWTANKRIRFSLADSQGTLQLKKLWGIFIDMF